MLQSACIRTKNLYRLRYKIGVSGRDFAICELTSILQPDTCGPALSVRSPDKMPNGCIETMQKDRPPDIRSLKNLSDAVRDVVSLFETLFFDFNENTEDAAAVRERHQSLRIRDGGQTGLHADAHTVQ